MLAPSRAPTDRSAAGESTFSSCITTSDGSYSMRAPASSARTRYSVSSPEDHGLSRARGRAPRRKRPTRSTSARAQEDRERDRAVPEILPGQQRGVRSPTMATNARLGRRRARSVRRAPAAVAKRRATRSRRSGWEDAVVVRKRDDVGAGPGRAPRCERARDPRGERSRTSSRARWSGEYVVEAVVVVLVDEQDPEGAVESGRSSEPSSRSSSATRSTVATTRSNEGSLGAATRRTLTPVPLVSVLLAVHNDARYLGEAARERACGRPSKTSS